MDHTELFVGLETITCMKTSPFILLLYTLTRSRPRDAFIGQSRSPNMVPFDMSVSGGCKIITFLESKVSY